MSNGPLSQLKNKNLAGLMVAISLVDLGAIIKGAELDYCNSLNKLKELLPFFHEIGVTQLYLYGGMFEMSNLSKQLHQVPTPDKHYIESKGATIVILGYDTKEKILLNEQQQEVTLRDKFGNPFSIYSMEKYNPKLSKDNTSKGTEQELQDVISQASSMGIRIFTDFIPWLSPDAVHENNYKWTFYKELEASELEKFNALPTELQKDRYIKRVLDKKDNNKYTAVRIQHEGAKETILLVNRLRFYGMYSADEVYLNICEKAVQDYFITSLKKMIDLGISGVRVDLGHLLLRSHIKNTYFDNIPKTTQQEYLNQPEEPLKRVIEEVKHYAQEKYQKSFEFIMEAYTDQDRADLFDLGADRVYYKEVFDDYTDIVRNNASVRKIRHHIATSTYSSILDEKYMIIFPSNYDEPPLKKIGGPKKALRKLLIALATINVPIMVDLREWVDHLGHIIPMVGGTGSHLFVSQKEFNERMSFSQYFDLITNKAPWTLDIKAFQSFIKTHEQDCIEFLDNSNLDKFLAMAWQDDHIWNIIVANFFPTMNQEIMWVELPNTVKEKMKKVKNEEFIPKICLYTSNIIDAPLEIKQITEKEKEFYRIFLSFEEGEEYKLIQIDGSYQE